MVAAATQLAPLEKTPEASLNETLGSAALRAGGYLLQQSSPVLAALAETAWQGLQPGHQAALAKLGGVNLGELPDGAARVAAALADLGRRIGEHFGLGPLLDSLSQSSWDPERDRRTREHLARLESPELLAAYERFVEGLRAGDSPAAEQGLTELRMILLQAEPAQRGEMLSALLMRSERLAKDLAEAVRARLRRCIKDMTPTAQDSGEEPLLVMRPKAAEEQPLSAGTHPVYELVWLTRLALGERREGSDLAEVCRVMGEAARRHNEEERRRSEQDEGGERRQRAHEITQQIAAALGPEALQTEAVRTLQSRSRNPQLFDQHAFAALEDSAVTETARRELSEKDSTESRISQRERRTA